MTFNCIEHLRFEISSFNDEPLAKFTHRPYEGRNSRFIQENIILKIFISINYSFSGRVRIFTWRYMWYFNKSTCRFLMIDITISTKWFVDSIEQISIESLFKQNLKNLAILPGCDAVSSFSFTSPTKAKRNLKLLLPSPSLSISSRKCKTFSTTGSFILLAIIDLKLIKSRVEKILGL